MKNRHLKKLFLITWAMFAVLITTSKPIEAGEKATFRWTDHREQGIANLNYGSRPVLRYMYGYDTTTPEKQHETYKVYHHVFGPGSDVIITKGPGGKYTHHRGLLVGWNKTGFEGKTLDFWHCTQGAHQRHAKFVELKVGTESGTMTSEIHWNDADGKSVITESRTVTVSIDPADSDPGYAWRIDWRTKLQSNRGEITLDGDRQHAGFQFRAAQPVAESNGARYIRPKEFPQQVKAVQVNDRTDPNDHVDLGWFAMTYELNGKRIIVEYFEDPSLPKPSRFSERPYGRFGAFFKTTLKENKPLTMRYRIRVSTGQPPSRESIQKRYDSFVAGLKSSGQ